MWRLVLTVSLLCWRCEGRVTCKNNNNGEVDWYILYKGPALNTLTGLEYFYIDQTGMTRMDSSVPNYKLINHPTGVLANTLRELFVTTMPQDIGFISYSDQPPNRTAPQTSGHSKGVLLMDKTTPTSTGVWLLHSTPNFPFRRDQNQFWPDTGQNYAQTFICVTFPYSQFTNIGNHLRYIRAFTFEHHVPGFHQELQDAANKRYLNPPQHFQQLTSNSGTVFHSIAKQQGPQAIDGDLYVAIAQDISSDLQVQTWGRQVERDSSFCDPNLTYCVYNVLSLKSNFGNWQPGSDHSKWCVAAHNNWICIADVNRAPTQYRRPGGALCMVNLAVADIFRGFVSQLEECPP